MKRFLILALAVGFATTSGMQAQPAGPEKVRYLRPAKDQWVPECEFTIQKSDKGWSIVSVTERGKLKLTVTARYDPQHKLVGAEAVQVEGEKKTTATVEVKDGKAKVNREGLLAQEFEVPKGVIVTSAPDWTDTFWLCRSFDRKQGGKQAFPGLWIHPTLPAQLLTFTIERQGTETVEHAGKPLTLERYQIRLRGDSPYAAWADLQGNLIRLIPLPAKEGTLSGLVHSDYEKTAARLKPPQP
jgi:hypothetical protein